MSFINRIVKFWRIQIALAREWRPESRHRGRRLLLVWVVDSLALLFVVWLLPGVQVRSVVGVVATAADVRARRRSAEETLAELGRSEVPLVATELRASGLCDLDEGARYARELDEDGWLPRAVADPNTD